MGMVTSPPAISRTGCRILDVLYRPSFSGHGCCIWWRHVWMSLSLCKMSRRKWILLYCLYSPNIFTSLWGQDSARLSISTTKTHVWVCVCLTVRSYKEVETGDIQVSLYCDGRRWARAMLSHGEGRPSWPFLHLPPTRESLTQSAVSSRSSPIWKSRSQLEFLRVTMGVLVWARVRSTLGRGYQECDPALIFYLRSW